MNKKDRIIDECISVTSGMSGHFAVHRVLVDDPSLGQYWDVQQTGIGRHKTAAGAIKEAKQWALSDGIPLAEHLQGDRVSNTCGRLPSGTSACIKNNMPNGHRGDWTCPACGTFYRAIIFDKGGRPQRLWIQQ